MTLFSKEKSYIIYCPLRSWSWLKKWEWFYYTDFQFFLRMSLIFSDIEGDMSMERVLMFMVILITSGLHPKENIFHTTSHGSKSWFNWIISKHEIWNISEYIKIYVVYSRDVLNLWVQGLREVIPLNSAGHLTLPPISVPRPRGVQNAANKLPYPLELPPTLLLWSQTFNDLPYKWLTGSQCIVVWDTLLLTKGIIPPVLRQDTIPQSLSLMSWALTVTPKVDLFPFWSK